MEWTNWKTLVLFSCFSFHFSCLLFDSTHPFSLTTILTFSFFKYVFPFRRYVLLIFPFSPQCILHTCLSSRSRRFGYFLKVMLKAGESRRNCQRIEGTFFSFFFVFVLFLFFLFCFFFSFKYRSYMKIQR